MKNDDYGSTKTVQEKIDEAYAAAEVTPAILTLETDEAATTRAFNADQAATVRALNAHLQRGEFLERDRQRMLDIQNQRLAREKDPEQYRQDISGMRSAPKEPEMLKKEANLRPVSSTPAIDSLTSVNEGPRMGQISARSLLIASVELIPTQPTETQWSAIKAAILSLPPAHIEE